MLEIVLMLMAAYCALHYAGIMCACLLTGVAFVTMCAQITNHTLYLPPLPLPTHTLYTHLLFLPLCRVVGTCFSSGKLKRSQNTLRYLSKMMEATSNLRSRVTTFRWKDGGRLTISSHFLIFLKNSIRLWVWRSDTGISKMLMPLDRKGFSALLHFLLMQELTKK